jgi:phenylacetic acid degradation operon negative regulatory protein
MDGADPTRAIARLTGALRLDAKSLIISLFGDAILPHGGAIWFGSLAGLAAPFGCNERVVRTSVFRLSKEGWLQATQEGRRAWYAPAPAALQRFEAADRIIYATGSKPWSENWTVVFTGLIEGEARESLRADLAWQGFGQLLPGVMLHPSPNEASVRQALGAAGGAQSAVVMKASGTGWMSAEALRQTAARAWDLARLAAAYVEFSANFTPFDDDAKTRGMPPALAFRLRILLIHAWRRAILRDPLLPEELLPKAWPGARARALCRDLYLRLYGPAEAYLLEAAEMPCGPVESKRAAYAERFGGLSV